MPQSKAPLQGVNESLPPSTQIAVQPGGVSRFTTALDPVPFWNLHLVAENQATKDHSAVLRADFQAATYPLGCPQFWGDVSSFGLIYAPPGIQRKALCKAHGKAVFGAVRHKQGTFQPFQSRCKTRNPTICTAFSTVNRGILLGAMEGTRTPGLLIRSARRAIPSIFGSYVLTLFLCDTSQVLSFEFLHPLSDFATICTLCTF